MARIFSVLFVLVFSAFLFAQDLPVVSGKGTPEIPNSPDVILYEQMSGAGTNSLTSQNFEASFDIYDSFCADDFVVTGGPWEIQSVENLGVYYNGTGPATSVNVWFYSNSGTLPGSQVAAYLNVVPTSGLATGSFTIPISPALQLPNGAYWVCIQANMDFGVGGQYGWTEHNQFNNPSAFQNPGGGFGTGCATWQPRVATCLVGAAPYYDMAFRLNGVIVPVELTSFTAIAGNGSVELNWITATETNNQGFEVQRNSGNGFEAIAFVNGHGTTTESQVYTYVDQDVNVGQYSYRLKQVDFDGSFEYSKVVEAEVLPPAEFSLAQNYPNPFNPSTQIDFSLAVDSKVTLTVYSLLGEAVATIVNNSYAAGTHTVNFDAAGLNSGVYFYRIDAEGINGENFTQVRKMMLTK